jgi:carboxymethylenebutenolidase
MCLDDDCRSEASDRRDFLKESAAVLASAGLYGTDAFGRETKPATRVLDDPRVRHGKVVFKHAGKETFDGFLARPASQGVFPAVLVIAGNRITEEYIPNTCAALALDGFVGLAPNVFHPLTEGDKSPTQVDKALRDHTESDVLQDIQVGADYLKGQPFVKAGHLGILGFCFGGRMSLLFGARSREIDAVVAFHPGPVHAAEVARLAASVQLHHGTADQSVNVENSKRLEKILKTQRTPVELFLYDGADHGFLAYTRSFYRPDDAKLAWRRASDFLARHLK